MVRVVAAGRRAAAFHFFEAHKDAQISPSGFGVAEHIEGLVGDQLGEFILHRVLLKAEVIGV